MVGVSKSLTRADTDGDGAILGHIGLTYDLLGEKEKALEYLTQAVSLSRVAKNLSGEANALKNAASVHLSLGEYQKALDIYQQVLPIFRSIGNRSNEAGTLLNIGRVYSALGEKQRALAFYDRSLVVFRSQNDRRGEATALNNIGAIHQRLLDFQKALDTFNQVLTISRSLNDRRLEAGALHNIAGLAPVSQQSLKLWNQALTLWRGVGDRSGESEALHVIGWIHQMAGDIERALAAYNQALSLSRRIDYPQIEAETLASIASIEFDRGKFREAREGIEAALQIVESLRGKVISQELRASYFASAQKYYEFYIDLLMQQDKHHADPVYRSLALQISERARARSLLESLVEAHAVIRQGADPALLERERKLQQQLNAKAEFELRMLSGSHTEEQAGAIKKEIEALISEYQQVQTQMRQASPRYAALTQPQSLTPEEIQQRVLDPDTLLLEYSLGDKRSYLWAVTQTTINSYELPKRVEIEEATKRVYDLLTIGNRGVTNETVEQRSLRTSQANAQYSDAAARLTQIVLAPAASLLGKKRLLIAADGALHYVPFAALPDPAITQRDNKEIQPLLVNHEIVNLPSASALAVLRQEISGRKSSDKTIAVLADPVFDANDERVKLPQTAARSGDKAKSSGEDLIGNRGLKHVIEKLTNQSGTMQIPRLPGTRDEAERILALADGEKMKALDFKASRATANGTELGKYRYIHFATHGLADSEHPELSTIVLSMVDERGVPQDGFLHAYEVYNLSLPADLVVLSACQTALGKQIKG